jgi:hypothetical protein
VARKRTKAADRRAATEQRHDRVGEQLDALYGDLPKLKCKGKCWKSCGPILISPGERARIRREAGIEIPPPEKMKRDGCDTCPALKDRKCTVYAIRPTICRLWGIDETIRCPLGCEPEGGWISRRESVHLSLRSYQIGGWPPEVPKLSPRQVDELMHRGEIGGLRMDMRVAHRSPEPAPQAERRGVLARWRRSK